MPPSPPSPDDRRLARREKPVSGQVEDYARHDDDEPDDGPLPQDLERFGDVTIRCPECRTELFDDVALCWKCGRAVGPGTEGDTKGPPLWVILAVVAIAAVFLLSFTRWGF